MKKYYIKATLTDSEVVEGESISVTQSQPYAKSEAERLCRKMRKRNPYVTYEVTENPPKKKEAVNDTESQ
jgi:hypothetical protein